MLDSEDFKIISGETTGGLYEHIFWRVVGKKEIERDFPKQRKNYLSDCKNIEDIAKKIAKKEHRFLEYSASQDKYDSATFVEYLREFEFSEEFKKKIKEKVEQFFLLDDDHDYDSVREGVQAVLNKELSGTEDKEELWKMTQQWKIFVELAKAGFQDKKIKRDLSERFSLTKKFWDSFANERIHILDKEQDAKIVVKGSAIQIERDLKLEKEDDKDTYLEEEKRIQMFREMFVVPKKEKDKQRQTMINWLRKKTSVDQAEGDLYGDPEVYDPSVHEQKDVSWTLTSRQVDGKIIARRRKSPEKKKEPLYIVLDQEYIMSIEKAGNYMTKQGILEAIKEFVRRYRYPIYVGAEASKSYYEILPNTNIDQLGKLLEVSIGNYDCKIRKGKRNQLQTNMVFLHQTNQARDSVHHQMGGKGESYTYDDLGLTLKPVIKKSWVENGFTNINGKVEDAA